MEVEMMVGGETLLITLTTGILGYVSQDNKRIYIFSLIVYSVKRYQASQQKVIPGWIN